MREAPPDISRRPRPDLTSVIQHAMAALESTVRSVTDEIRLTLGATTYPQLRLDMVLRL